MKRLLLAISVAVLFTVTPFSLTSWAQAAPANSPAPEKPAGRVTHHKAHSAQLHAPHQAQRHAPHQAQGHAPHDAERHAQRHAKRRHRRQAGT
jgi:hypothetical protein